MRWLSDYRRDVARFRKQRPLEAVLRNQGLWALFQYRVAREVYASELPPRVKNSALAIMYGWRKVVEVMTGISLPHTADIEPGVLFPHYGTIVINKDAHIGSGTTILQGVTIGETRNLPGAPHVGRNVLIGANAVVVGDITVGDGARIGALTFVDDDVKPGATVHPGVPAVGEP